MNYPRIGILLGAGAAARMWSAGAGAQAPSGSKTIAEAGCTAAKLGDGIPITSIGEPVSAVTLSAPRWNAAAKGLPPYCTVNGAMASVDRAPNAKPINFQVAFPSAWNGRAAQLGGGGMNGTIPGLTGGGPGNPFSLGFVTTAPMATASRLSPSRSRIRGIDSRCWSIGWKTERPRGSRSK